MPWLFTYADDTLKLGSERGEILAGMAHPPLLPPGTHSFLQQAGRQKVAWWQVWQAFVVGMVGEGWW